MSKPKQSVYEARERIRAAIDRGEWKHSWHLPKDEYGYIKWHNVETRRKCHEIIQQEMDYAIALLTRAQSLLTEVDWRLDEKD